MSHNLINHIITQLIRTAWIGQHQGAYLTTLGTSRDSVWGRKKNKTKSLGLHW
jgi:hypothetical protein